jgi:hypothetical protein
MVKFTGKAQKRTIQSFFTVASTSIPEKVVASSPAKKSKLEDSPHPVASTSADSGPMQAASVFASTSLAQAVPEATSHASKQSRRTVTIRPFESLEAHTYTCPFKTIGACKRSETFSNFKALASHCHAKHRGLIVTPVEGDPLEDGTRKIPCRRNCGEMFASYTSAVAHAKGSSGGCTKPVDTGFPQACPWSGCTTVSADSKAYATHSISHRGDKRGRYQCSKCDDYAEDLYMLASHETRCKGEVVGQRRFEGVYKLELSRINDDQGADTSLLIVARSSSHAPKSWYCGQEFLSDRLSIFAKRAYDYYQSDMNAPSALTAKFVALYDVHTRLIPTGEHSEAHTTNDPSIKSFFSRAHKFTSAIDQAFVNSSQHHSQHSRVHDRMSRAGDWDNGTTGLADGLARSQEARYTAWKSRVEQFHNSRA